MIVRILGEGQFDVPDGTLDTLNALDEQLVAAVDTDDEQGFRAALRALLDEVRTLGSALPAERLEPSELVLPSTDAALAEVRDLLGDDGLIPG